MSIPVVSFFDTIVSALQKPVDHTLVYNTLYYTFLSTFPFVFSVYCTLLHLYLDITLCFTGFCK